MVTRSLLVLADIAATRYFRPVPVDLRDPILTANGDRLRAECFSACNGVLARLDLLEAGLDGGQIGHGTTNVDIGPAMRQALTRVPRGGLLHLDVGADRLRASTPAETVEERRVQMPDRWVRALGNAAELTQPLVEQFSVGAAAARRFVQTRPRAGAARADEVWLSAARGQLMAKPHRTPGAVRLTGTHRLAAVSRLLVDLQGLTVYAADDGVTALEFALPGARLTLVLTAEPFRGFSGEGSLLTALAAPNVAEDVDLVSALLAFDPRIDEVRLAREADLSEAWVRAALAVLGASGRVGWDNHERAWFHREVPHTTRAGSSATTPVWSRRSGSLIPGRSPGTVTAGSWPAARPGTASRTGAAPAPGTCGTLAPAGPANMCWRHSSRRRQKRQERQTHEHQAGSRHRRLP